MPVPDARALAEIFRASAAPVTFEPRRHTYTSQTGERLPAVSDIIRASGQRVYDDIPAHVLSRKAVLGHIIHELTDIIDGGSQPDVDAVIHGAMHRAGFTMTEETVDTYAEQFFSYQNVIPAYIEAYQKFCKFYRPEWLLRETIVANRLDEFPYAGTLDRFGVIERENTRPLVVDIKTTSRQYQHHLVQCAGYAMTLGDHVAEVDLGVLYLHSDGRWFFRLAEPDEAFAAINAFHAYRRLYYAIEDARIATSLLE